MTGEISCFRCVAALTVGGRLKRHPSWSSMFVEINSNGMRACLCGRVCVVYFDASGLRLMAHAAS